jgi:hypothetical protein
MTAYLVNLSISNEFTITSRRGDKVTSSDRVSESGLRAHLILNAGPEATDLENLGYVHVHIEAQPRSLPAMTQVETLDYLRDALKRML